MDKEEELLNNIIKMFEEMDEDKQIAFCSFIKNLDLVEEVIQGKKLTEEKVETFFNIASQRNDYFIKLLILYNLEKDK